MFYCAVRTDSLACRVIWTQYFCQLLHKDKLYDWPMLKCGYPGSYMTALLKIRHPPSKGWDPRCVGHTRSYLERVVTLTLVHPQPGFETTGSKAGGSKIILQDPVGPNYLGRWYMWNFSWVGKPSCICSVGTMPQACSSTYVS